MTTRPVTRITCVLAHEDASLAPLVESLAQSLSLHGVQCARHVKGTPADTAFRADVALWFTGDDGHFGPPERREVSARVHALVVDDAPKDVLHLSAYDAVITPHETLVQSVRHTLMSHGHGEVAVVPISFCLERQGERDSSRARRHLDDRPCVLVDVRQGFERDIERVVIQLALVSAPFVPVILVPHDERSRLRTRTLAITHGVNAFLSSGSDALGHALPSLDLVIGRPRPFEILLAAAHGVAVTWLDGDTTSTPVPVDPWRRAKILSSSDGVLHLASALERRLADRGGLATEGTLLQDALIGSARAFIDALGEIREHVPVPRGTSAWEPIGPQADKSIDGEHRVIVDVAGTTAEVARAAKIEEALDALKARLKDEGAA